MDTAFEGFEGIKLDFGSEEESQIEDQNYDYENHHNYKDNYILL